MSEEVTQQPVEETKPNTPSPEDEAAYIYQHGMEKALNIAANMKAGELYRVFANFVQFPLVENPKKLRSDKENALFALLIRTAQAKNTLLEAFKQQVSEAENEVNQTMANELLTETKTQE